MRFAIVAGIVAPLLPGPWAGPAGAQDGRLAEGAVAVRILLGVGDEQVRPWDGRARVDRGEVVRVEPWRFREGHRIVGSELRVRAIVRGTDDAAFADAARRADEGCPFSALIRASGTVSIDATLEAS